MITLNTNPGLLRTAVYERILSDLQQGAIAPGETISLNKLAETLNISKTPLRDALLELQAEELRYPLSAARGHGGMPSPKRRSARFTRCAACLTGRSSATCSPA